MKKLFTILLLLLAVSTIGAQTTEDVEDTQNALTTNIGFDGFWGTMLEETDEGWDHLIIMLRDYKTYTSCSFIVDFLINVQNIGSMHLHSVLRGSYTQEGNLVTTDINEESAVFEKKLLLNSKFSPYEAELKDEIEKIEGSAEEAFKKEVFESLLPLFKTFTIEKQTDTELIVNMSGKQLSLQKWTHDANFKLGMKIINSPEK
ncbi:MAG: hypothetical protein J5610_05010 [Prevotella sp.]|nr:hypothetical protein [Prevotella sp.]